MTEISKVRLDKWLWSVRMYKSRTMASDACRSNKVKVNDVHQKPSFLLQHNDTVTIRKNGFNLQFKVLGLIEKRVSATLASQCFADITPAEELSKYKDWFVGKAGSEFREKGEGRPTKRDRREMDDFKLFYFDDDEDLLD